MGLERGQNTYVLQSTSPFGARFLWLQLLSCVYAPIVQCVTILPVGLSPKSTSKKLALIWELAQEWGKRYFWWQDLQERGHTSEQVCRWW